MASKFALSDDQARFTKVGMAVIDTFTGILRDLLSREIPAADVKNKVQKCTTLPKKSLRTDQNALIDKASTDGYRNFDISLLYILLRNVCQKITQPTKGWGNVHKLPKSGEVTVGDDIERIRIIRNNVYGHVATTSIAESQFKDYWAIITDVCHRMDIDLGSNYEQNLQNIQNCVLDPALLEKFKNIFESNYQKENLAIEAIHNLEETLEEIKESITGNRMNPITEHQIELIGEPRVKHGENADLTAIIPSEWETKEMNWQRIDDHGTHFINIQDQKYSGSLFHPRMARLVINNVDYNDTGVYQIEVRSKRGMQTNRQISIHVYGDPPAVDILTPQHIGATIIIPCNISEKSSAVSLRWTKDGKDLNVLASNGRFSGGTTSHPSLTINAVNRDDVGNYQCIVSNMYGTTESKSMVLGLPNIIVRGPWHEGRNIRLFCEIDCLLPVTQLMWRKDGKELKSDYNDEGSLYKQELKIVNVQHKHSGVYTCSAQNAFGMIESDPISLDIPVVVISCPPRVVYGDMVEIQAEIKHGENFTFRWMKSTCKEGNYVSLRTNAEKYSMEINSGSSCKLRIHCADFSDSALYHVQVYPDMTQSGFYGSDTVQLIVTGGVPSIQNDTHLSVVFGTNATLCATIHSTPMALCVKWMKIIDCVATEIDITSSKYTGSTEDVRNPCLVIRKADFTDKAIYQINVSNLLGSVLSEFTLEITGALPNASISGLALHEEKICLMCKGSVTEDSPKVTSVKWFKDGEELARNYHYKYSDTGVLDFCDMDVSLEIGHVDHSVIGEYQCIITNPLGETKSNIFYIDRLYSLKLEVQAVLCCFFLQNGHCIDLQEESWLKYLKSSSDFCKCKLQTTDDFQKVLKDKIQDLNEYLDRESNTLSLKNPQELLNPFKGNINFIDFFLKNACKENIAKYCRTPKYETKDNEVCFRMNIEQTGVFVDRLQTDILTHCTLEDESIHELVVRKLKIPKEILHWGQKGIQTFLENLSQGSVPVYHARGMIVGCAGAGKTTLLKKLKGMTIEEIEKTESTRGIEVHKDIFTVTEGDIQVATVTQKSHFNINHGYFMAPKQDTTAEYIKGDGHISTLFDIFFESTSESNAKSNTNDNDMEEIESKSDNDSDMQELESQLDGANKRTYRSAFDVEESENQSEHTDDQIEKKLKQSTPTNENLLNAKGNDSIKKLSIYISTKGQRNNIQMEQHLMQIDTLSVLNSLNESNMKCITFLDFAGQCIYYACHQIYLSPRAFYLLVMDMSQKLKDIVSKDVCTGENSFFRDWTYKDFFAYWMRSIHSYSSNTSPVIPIASHAEKKTREEIRQHFFELWEALPREIRENHLDHKKEFFVEKDSDKNIKELKKCIAELVEQQPYWGELQPASWVLFEHHLTELRTEQKLKTMQTAQLWQQNKALKEKFQLQNNADMMIMLKFFHETGFILFFDEEILKDTIILDIQWFVDCFKHIITDKTHAEYDLRECKGSCLQEWKKFNENGILHCDLLLAIWELTDETYIQNKDDIMMYMERLGMLAKIHYAPEKWYVPCMNKMHFPTEYYAEHFDISPSLCFLFPFLPITIYHRLIATCLSQLKFSIPTSGENKIECLFQNAVLFQSQTLEACYILIGYCQDLIEMQILSSKYSTVIHRGGRELKEKISKQLERLMTTFHTNIEQFSLGYRCKKCMFGTSPKTHVILEKEYLKEDVIECPHCELPKERIKTTEVLAYWKTVSYQQVNKTCRLDNSSDTDKINVLTPERNVLRRQRINEKRKVREVDKLKTQSGIVSTTENRVRCLEPEEEYLINEVVGAYRQSLEVSINSELPKDKPHLHMGDLANIAELSVRRIIDMAKKIKSFQALSQTDQINLLKGGSIELLILRSVISFDKEKQQWLDPTDSEEHSMNLDNLREGQGASLFAEHMKFIKSLVIDLMADEIVLILLLVISLFSPDRPNISDKSYICDEQEKYALLLLRYLESKYTSYTVRAIYPKLLMKLTDIRDLHEEHSHILLKVNPEGLQPLMKDVLDMHLKGGAPSQSQPQM